MPNVKVGIRAPNLVADSNNGTDDVTSEHVRKPSFNIKRIPGVFQVEVPVENLRKSQSLNKDFRKRQAFMHVAILCWVYFLTLWHFIDRDVHLRELYARLRLLAIVLFASSVLASCLAVADIEFGKIAMRKMAEALNCEESYIGTYNRNCPPLLHPQEVMRDHLINESVYDVLMEHDTYFGRWMAANQMYSADVWYACIVLKVIISLLSLVSVYCMISYHKSELNVLKLKRYLPEESHFFKSPKIKSFLFKTLIVLFHVPPLTDAWIDPEIQMVVSLRIVICGIKVMKECNELRYHRLGNVLSNLARIKIHGTFLLKTYFLNYPQTTLFIVYLIVVGGFPYLVILTEDPEGHIVSYKDAWWLMVVTVTNLGSGEVRPRSVLARIVVGFGALVGIVTTALWVNVFSKFLELPHEERRILAMVEHQRVRRLERKTAAICIQTAWRLHALSSRENGKRKKSKLDSLERASKKAVWDWKCTRQNCSRIRRTVEHNFSTEDTLIAANTVARTISSNIETARQSIAIPWDRRGSSPFANFLTAPPPEHHGSDLKEFDHDGTKSSIHGDEKQHLRTDFEDNSDLRHLVESISRLQSDLQGMRDEFHRSQRVTLSQFSELRDILNRIKMT